METESCDYDFQWQCDLFYFEKDRRICIFENYQLSFAFRFKIGINRILFEFKSFGVNLYL